MSDFTPSAARAATPDATSTPFPGFKPLSANFTSTPNQFFDRILGHYHPCVVTVVGILIRSTLGWQDPHTGARKVEAELPLSAFVRPELSRPSARKGLALAIEAGFVVQTLLPTNKEAARYALRWEDEGEQAEGITKQRRGEGFKAKRWGVTVTPHRWSRGVAVRRVTVTGVTVTPPIVKKPFPEKKEDIEKPLASSPSGEEEARNVPAGRSAALARVEAVFLNDPRIRADLAKRKAGRPLPSTSGDPPLLRKDKELGG